jgi:NAD-dependent deacetylase
MANGFRPIEAASYRRITVLTGAGISAASGLPTYRGAGGLWTAENIRRYATAAAVRDDPRAVWTFFARMRGLIAEAVPNGAHLALATLGQRLTSDQTLTVLTQNVDGLHQAAGSQNVVELHGSLHRSRCTECEYSRAEELAACPSECPKCPSCSSWLRPAVVFFDEFLAVDDERSAKHALRDCDLFLAVGTSGSVAPASNYVRAARFAGARTIYVNLEPMLPANPEFQELVLGRAEEVLPRLLNVAV